MCYLIFSLLEAEKIKQVFEMEEKEKKIKEQHESITKDMKLKQIMGYFERTDLFQELIFLKDIDEFGKLVDYFDSYEQDLDLFCQCKKII